MPITEFLERNATLYKDDVSLVEINPEVQEKSRVTWREYSLIEANPNEAYRKEITWSEFNKRANRFANFLLSVSLIARFILPVITSAYIITLPSAFLAARPIV